MKQSIPIINLEGFLTRVLASFLQTLLQLLSNFAVSWYTAINKFKDISKTCGDSWYCGKQHRSPGIYKDIMCTFELYVEIKSKHSYVPFWDCLCAWKGSASSYICLYALIVWIWWQLSLYKWWRKFAQVLPDQTRISSSRILKWTAFGY